MEIQPSTSTSANQSKVKPTDLDIIRHWIYLEDQNRMSNSVNIVTDNLVEFYTKNHPFVELSSRKSIYNSISRLIKRTEKFHKVSNLKYAQDKNWIEKNLKEGKWEQIRDISQKSSPLSVAETESLISPLSPSKRPADDLGRGKRIKFQNPKYR